MWILWIWRALSPVIMLNDESAQIRGRCCLFIRQIQAIHTYTVRFMCWCNSPPNWVSGGKAPGVQEVLLLVNPLAGPGANDVDKSGAVMEWVTGGMSAAEVTTGELPYEPARLWPRTEEVELYRLIGLIMKKYCICKENKDLYMDLPSTLPWYRWKESLKLMIL